jgi:predicted DNA-binding transcriptional regulator AlpA
MGVVMQSVAPAPVMLIDGQAFQNTINAAKTCGLSIAQFHRNVKAYPERFKPIRLGAKCVRFKVSDLVAAMNSFASEGGGL